MNLTAFIRRSCLTFHFKFDLIFDRDKIKSAFVFKVNAPHVIAGIYQMCGLSLDTYAPSE